MKRLMYPRVKGSKEWTCVANASIRRSWIFPACIAWICVKYSRTRFTTNSLKCKINFDVHTLLWLMQVRRKGANSVSFHHDRMYKLFDATCIFYSDIKVRIDSCFKLAWLTFHCSGLKINKSALVKFSE